MKKPRSSPWIAGSTTCTSLMISDSVTVAISRSPVRVRRASVELHLRVVAEHQAQRVGAPVRAGHLDLAPDERIGQLVDAEDLAPRKDDRMVELRVDDLAVR